MIPSSNTYTNYGTTTRQRQITSTSRQIEPSVLLVEDDPVMVKLLSFALEKRGFAVNIATDGQKALDYLANNEEPHLVLLDLKINHRLQFQYQEELVEDIQVTAYFQKKPLNFVLQKILEGTKLDFEIKP